MMYLFLFLILVIRKVFAENTLRNGGFLPPLPRILTKVEENLPNGDGSYTINEVFYAGNVGSVTPANSLMRSNELYILLFQEDGNLVIYTNPKVYGGMYLVWASSGNFVNPERLLMTNGELQACDTSKNIKWRTLTSGTSNSYLKLDDDGRLRIYDGGVPPLWISTIPGMKLIILLCYYFLLDYCFSIAFQKYQLFS